MEYTRKIVATTRWIVDELRRIDDVKVIGTPEVSVVAIGSDRFNIYALSEQLKQRGWNLNALQFPQCIHLCCTVLQTKPGVKERFVKDVRELAAVVAANPEKYNTHSVAMYGE